jgi:release factor glutamine methyltransferase
MPTIAQAIQDAEAALSEAEIPESFREAKSLLQFTIARDRAFVVAHPEYELTQHESELFIDAVTRRAARVPFQQIVGRQEFYGLDFIVTPDVLIPRPETEILVEHAIETIGDREARFLDIGVGSGCISVAILKNCRTATGLAVDVSPAAIEVATRNSSLHGVQERLVISVSDVFEKVTPQRFDLIVSNPPYVPLGDIATLQPEVRDHEPHQALTDGSNGLSIIEKIVAGSPEHLAPDGYLLMEIGFGQSEAVETLFDPAIWPRVDIIPDLQGIPRIVIAQLG